MANTGSEAFIRRPALYIVATPIGNLGDLSQRAITTLQAVDLIAAEDTRHSARLLQHFAISTPMTAYHDFSSDGREGAILARLAEGKALALISDAGTPLISDPGYSLVVRAREMGIPVVPIPGACALTAAISAAGLPSDRFIFEGFPPHKSSSRLQLFSDLSGESRTLVFYESPHRIVASVRDMKETFGPDRHAVICRELTKTWESIHGDTLAGLIDWLESDDNNQRGEFVVLLRGKEKQADTGISPEAEKALTVLMRELPLKKAAAMAAEISGCKKNRLYKRGLALASAAEGG